MVDMLSETNQTLAFFPLENQEYRGSTLEVRDKRPLAAQKAVRCASSFHALNSSLSLSSTLDRAQSSSSATVKRAVKSV